MLLLTVGQGLSFPAAEYMRDEIFRYCFTAEKNVLIVVDGSHVQNVDATVAKVSMSLISTCSMTLLNIYRSRK